MNARFRDEMARKIEAIYLEAVSKDQHRLARDVAAASERAEEVERQK